MHVRSLNRNMNEYQCVEVIHVAGEGELRRADGNGWLDVTAICDVLRPKVNGHVD